MKTLSEEITRIKSEMAEIASKASTGKTIQEQVEHLFTEIIPQKYNEGKEMVDMDCENCAYGYYSEEKGTTVCIVDEEFLAPCEYDEEELIELWEEGMYI